jgi:hypothetical protein
LGTLFATGGAVYASLGGKKDSASSGKPLAERVKEAVPINAGSRCVYSYSRLPADRDSLGVSTVKRNNCMYSIRIKRLVLQHGLTRMNSIKNFIAEAEKEGGVAHH